MINVPLVRSLDVVLTFYTFNMKLIQDADQIVPAVPVMTTDNVLKAVHRDTGVLLHVLESVAVIV